MINKQVFEFIERESDRAIKAANDGIVKFDDQGNMYFEGSKLRAPVRKVPEVKKIEFSELQERAEHGVDLESYSFAESLRVEVPGSPGVHTTATGDQVRKDRESKYRPVIVRGTEYDHGLFWQLFLDSGQYRRSITGHKTKLVGSAWRIEKPSVPDDATKKQAKLARRQTEWVKRALFEHSNWIQFLEETTFQFVSGNALFVPVYYPKDHKTRPCQIKKFKFRYTHTVDGWVEDEYGELLGVQFKDPNSKDGSAKGYFVPAEDLLFLRYDAYGNDWEGNSPLRSIGRWIMAKLLFSKLEALAYEKYGIPLVTIEWNESVTLNSFSAPADDDDLVLILDAFVATDKPVVELPFGRKLVMHSPEGAVPDFDPIKRYCDEQIHSILMDELSLMGTRNSPGSYNLGETKADEKLGFIPFISAKICAEINGDHGDLHGGIIPRMIDAAIEAGIFSDHVYDENEQRIYPRLSHGLKEERESEEKTRQIGQAVRDGMITWTAQDEAAERNRLGLPEMSVEEIKAVAEEQAKEAIERMQQETVAQNPEGTETGSGEDDDVAGETEE